MTATGNLTATGTASSISAALGIRGGHSSKYLNSLYAWPNTTGGFGGGTVTLMVTPDAEDAASRRWFPTDATLTASGVVNFEARFVDCAVAVQSPTSDHDVNFKVM